MFGVVLVLYISHFPIAGLLFIEKNYLIINYYYSINLRILSQLLIAANLFMFSIKTNF